MARTVLVTGGAGYIGSHVCKALDRRGDLPVVLDDLSRGHAGAVRWGPLEVRSLADAAGLREVFARWPIDAVVHLAGYAYVGESVASPELYFRNNVVGSLTLLEAMRTTGVDRLVFSSTCTVYGVPQQLPIAEDHPLAPLSPYGESKLFVERALQAYGSAHRLRSIRLRYFNAAGADPEGELVEDHDPETHLIPLALRAAAGLGPALQIFGTDWPTPDGTAIRDYVHVQDLAEAHVLALDHLALDRVEPGGPSQALNLGTGRGHSVREVVAAAERVSGLRVPVVPKPRRPGDGAVMIADARRAGRVLGWRPGHTELDAIVASAWRSIQGQPAVAAREAATAGAQSRPGGRHSDAAPAPADAGAEVGGGPVLRPV